MTDTNEMTPLERAAKAIDDLLGVDGQLDATPEEAARAVLEAIREPSEVMVAGAGINAPEEIVFYDRADVQAHLSRAWQAMIDAALEEG